MDSREPRFHVGDLVEIKSGQEYRSEGHDCSDHCAITCYAGTVAEVTEVSEHGYRLKSISLMRNFDPNAHEVFNFSYYTWRPAAVKLFEECNNEPNADDGFFEVFECEV